MKNNDDQLKAQLASALEPQRPDPQFEEDLLLRLDDEFDRVENEELGDEPVTLEVVGSTADAKLQWPRWLKPTALVAAALALAIGGWQISRPDAKPTKTAGDPAPGSAIIIESAVDRVEVACRDLFGDGLSSGVVEPSTDQLLLVEEIPGEGLARVQDLALIISRLTDAIADDPELASSRDSLSLAEATRQNLELLIATEVYDPVRYSLAATTARVVDVLAELERQGAKSCATWADTKETN